MQTNWNLDDLIADVAATVENHKTAQPGAYARYLWDNAQHTRKLGSNEYGCADAANIRYIIEQPERDPATRAACIRVLQDFQHADGRFDEGTHHPLHCTAHCTAALELFDALPRRPLAFCDGYRTVDGLYALLDGLNWTGRPWDNAHQGAGVFAALTLTRSVDLAWQDAYFGWLDAHADPEYGYGRAGAIQTGLAPQCHHIYGWFHYLFNYEYAHRAYPYAEKLVDGMIDLYDHGKLSATFGKIASFCEIDWLFTLHRAARQTGHRLDEARDRIRRFADGYFASLRALDKAHDETWNDLHMLFGACCALAEIQLALPGEVRTTVPLRGVLDRRPFI